MNILSVSYIIAQLLAFIAFVISLIAYHRNKKEKIFCNMLISNILNLFHYLLLGAFSGSITKVIAILRDLTIIKKKDNKILSSNYILILFIITYIFTAIFTYKNIYSLFPIIAAIIYTISIWNGDALRVKKTAFFCEFLWLGYNIFVFSIVGIIAKVTAIISTYIAIKNANNKINKSV